jgi:purine-cytosine permease-like protein
LAPLVLLVVGLLLAGSSPGLAAAIATDPVGAIAMTLPIWFLVPFAVVAVLGLVGGAVIDIYSSGLALLAAGLRVPRPAAAAIDGVIMIAGTVYVVFIAGHFLGEFIGFLITLGVPIAAWCGVILADVLVRRSDYDDNDLYRPAGRYGDVRVGPLVLIVIATVLGWGLVTNAGAGWLQWQGYLLGPIGGRQGAWAGANLGVLVALVVPFAVTLLSDHARTEHARRRVAEPVPRFRQA